MRVSTRKAAVLAGTVLAVLLGTSCGPRLGWGLLLWTDQEAGLHAGAVVPVFIRSNIEKKYVIGVPGSDRKVEVPLWQLGLYRSKGAAEKARSTFGSYLTSYLFANRDGLPVRDAPSNSGSRVYRLREGQSVKILAKVQGDEVRTGSIVLDGSWFRVLTEDGTEGYVFSNTMRLYDELTESPPTIAQSNADDTARNVDLVFSRTWRPEYFQTMIDDGRIDLDGFNARYGLFSDAVRRQIRIELPYASQVFNYTSIAQSGQDFVFEGTPLRIRFDGDKRLVADWSGTSGDEQGSGVTQAPQLPVSPTGPQAAANPPPAASQGQGGQSPAGSGATIQTSPDQTQGPSSAAAPQGQSPSAGGQSPTGVDMRAGATQASFVVLVQDIRDVIRAEETRRINLLGRFVDGGESWVYRSDSGTVPGDSKLTVSRSGRFIWSSIESVPAEYVGVDLGDVSNGLAVGEATVRLDLDPSLVAWEGALSLRFDGTGSWLDFLYRHDGGRLVLQPVASGSIRDLVVSAAATTAPLVLDPSR